MASFPFIKWAKSALQNGRRISQSNLFFKRTIGGEQRSVLTTLVFGTVFKISSQKQIDYKIKNVYVVTKSMQYVISPLKVFPFIKYGAGSRHSDLFSLFFKRFNNASRSVVQSLVFGNSTKQTKTLSFSYRVIATKSAITKGLQYGVSRVMPLIPKALNYVLVKSYNLSKSLDYDIIKPYSISKGLVYRVSNKVSPILKSLDYDVVKPTSLTKQLQYSITNVVTAISKQLSYQATNKVAQTKSISYQVTRAISSIQKSLAYRVSSKVSPFTKLLNYVILKKTSFTRSLNYQVGTKHLIQKNLNYYIASEAFLVTKFLSYQVTSIISNTKQLAYSIGTLKSITRQLEYKVTNKVTQNQKQLSYIVLSSFFLQKVLTYQVTSKRLVQLQLSYKIAQGEVITKSMSYEIDVVGVPHLLQKQMTYSIVGDMYVSTTSGYDKRVSPYEKETRYRKLDNY